MKECIVCSRAWLAGVCRLIFWELRVVWQKVTQYFHTLSLSPQTHHRHGCHVFLACHHQLSLSVFLPCLLPPSPCVSQSLFFFLFFLFSLISSNLPHGDWARAPASAHFERCCRPKNARSKHMRAVFIINQLYGPLMEVISAKFMLRDFAVFSKTAAR